MSLVKTRIQESIDVKKRVLEDDILLMRIEEAAIMTRDSIINDGGRLVICGNGGSSSDALHIAAELTGRFQKDRRALPAIALGTNIAYMTAVSNDYCYEYAFERETEAILNSNDIFIGISTSGNSNNVYKALLKAKDIGAKTIALLGYDGGKIKGIADIDIVVPSNNTARIQETHILIGHCICELVEDQL